MGLFRKKKKVEEVVDSRTDIEKKCEDTGQELGRKTGVMVQKGVDKLNSIKQNLEDNGTMDKVRNAQVKVDETMDKVVDTVSKQVNKVVSKSGKSKPNEFYE